MSLYSAESASPSRSFLKGAFILTIGMVIVKFCGLLQKVLLTNLYSTLGESYGEFGSGLFANAYEIYVPLFTLATIGFPVALSRMISESYARRHYSRVHRVFCVARPFFIVTGTICFLLMAVGSFWYVRYIDSPYSLMAMLIMSPTILFGCLISVYRGYFEGLRDMTPTSVSEIMEAIAKIAVGVTLSYFVVNKGVREYSLYGTVFNLNVSDKDEAFRTIVAFSVAASILGITFGSVISFVYLRLLYMKRKKLIPEEREESFVSPTDKEIFFSMFRMAIPVGIGTLFMSFAGSLDAAMLNRILRNMSTQVPEKLLSQYPLLRDEIFVSGTAHTCIWGYYSSCLTIYSIVAAVTQVLGTSALPNVTNAFAKGDRAQLKSSIETVIRISAIFAFPCGLGLCVLAKPILSLVYFANPNIALYGTPVLQVLGISSAFFGICTPLCSMLQGIGKAAKTMTICITGTVLKVIVSFFFAQNISVNIAGTAIGSVVSAVFMSVTAMYYLLKYTGVRFDYLAVLLKPFVSSLICALCAYVCYYIFSLNVLISVVISAILYAVFLLILHTFSKNEIEKVLNCKKIVIILEKHR